MAPFGIIFLILWDTECMLLADVVQPEVASLEVPDGESIPLLAELQESQNSMDGAPIYWFEYSPLMKNELFTIQFPESIYMGIGQLFNTRLDFTEYDSNYFGGIATACPLCGENVFGTVWQLQWTDLKELKSRPEIQNGRMKMVQTNVQLVDSAVEVECFFITAVYCPPQVFYGAGISEANRPSMFYLRDLTSAALSSGLPDSYITHLSRLPTNGFDY